MENRYNINMNNIIHSQNSGVKSTNSHIIINKEHLENTN